jgi:hypothetical protein
MSWKGFVRNRSWPDLKYYAEDSLEGLRKATITSVTLFDVRVEIRTGLRPPPEYKLGPSPFEATYLDFVRNGGIFAQIIDLSGSNMRRALKVCSRVPKGSISCYAF